MGAKKESSLTTGELRRLANHEEVIERGVQSFIDVGNALAAIKKEALYTDVDKTFEGYCKKRWGFSRPRAYQLIDAAKVVEVVSTIVDTPPANEAQARVLAALPDAQTQATVWSKAVETAPKSEDGAPKVTAAHVKRVADEVSPPKPANGKGKAAPVPEPEPEPEPEADPDSLESVQADLRDYEKQLRDLARLGRKILGAEGNEVTRPWCSRYSLLTLVQPLQHVARTVLNDLPVGGKPNDPKLHREQVAEQA